MAHTRTKYTYDIIPKINTNANSIILDPKAPASMHDALSQPILARIIASTPPHNNPQALENYLRKTLGDDIIDNTRKIVLIETEELPA
jgi:hypothetical protein